MTDKIAETWAREGLKMHVIDPSDSDYQRGYMAAVLELSQFLGIENEPEVLHACMVNGVDHMARDVNRVEGHA